jgi:hypothetical protein
VDAVQDDSTLLSGYAESASALAFHFDCVRGVGSGICSDLRQGVVTESSSEGCLIEACRLSTLMSRCFDHDVGQEVGILERDGT